MAALIIAMSPLPRLNARVERPDALYRSATSAHTAFGALNPLTATVSRSAPTR